MNKTIFISSRDEYKLCIDEGFDPLIDIRFSMDIRLRIEIQKEIFGHCIIGRGNIPAANDRFYKWVWICKNPGYPKRCEETLKPLWNYTPVHISHILTRGAHPEMAHDPRNVNILSFECHNRWENGDRKNMRIYPSNMKIIELLKKEYNL